MKTFKMNSETDAKKIDPNKYIKAKYSATEGSSCTGGVSGYRSDEEVELIWRYS